MTRREAAADGAESTTAGGGIRRLEGGLIHQVEKLRAEFELADLRPKREVLTMGSAKSSTAGTSERRETFMGLTSPPCTRVH